MASGDFQFLLFVLLLLRVRCFSPNKRDTSQSYISKGIWRQGIGSFVRNSYVSTLCPVVICPYLCTSEHRLRAQVTVISAEAPMASGDCRLILRGLHGLRACNNNDNNDNNQTTIIHTIIRRLILWGLRRLLGPSRGQVPLSGPEKGRPSGRRGEAQGMEMTWELFLFGFLLIIIIINSYLWFLFEWPGRY